MGSRPPSLGRPQAHPAPRQGQLGPSALQGVELEGPPRRSGAAPGSAAPPHHARERRQGGQDAKGAAALEQVSNSGPRNSYGWAGRWAAPVLVSCCKVAGVPGASGSDDRACRAAGFVSRVTGGRRRGHVGACEGEPDAGAPPTRHERKPKTGLRELD